MISIQFLRTVLLGIRSLALHKLRSALTVLGMIFGVASVIAMLSIGEGANFAAQEEIKKLGSQNIILKSLIPKEEGQAGVSRSEVVVYGLTYEDLRRLKGTIPAVRQIVPMRIVHTDGRYRQERMDVQAVGTIPELLEVSNTRVARGRFITSNDLDTKRAVCVLGSEVAQALFPVEDSLGNDVKVGTDYYKVIGITEPTGAATGTGGVEADDRNRDVYVPLTTLENYVGQIIVRVVSGSRHMEKVELHQIIVGLESDQAVPPTAKVLRGLLERYHKRKDFDVLVPLELLQQKEQTKRIFNIVLGSIAAISLLVGGIGIMNIMLANITERTREIGIRRALGAKRRDIVSQFLVETVVLSTAGGLLGILLGVAIPFVVEAMSGLKTIITTFSLILSFGISAAVGIIFGIYPATKAASLDPIEALRRE
ncbi:MAG: ABC transporter permease [Planctomycetes bacterium]|nr:ABC transporter permease [Planctomycetota bacterium]